jgi:four helix bundle protein
MSSGPTKPYDLEERTFEFAKSIRTFLKTIPRTIANLEDGKQLIRSSGSIGANYIEANESLGRRDFKLHLRISRKEAKESIYWLRLLDVRDEPQIERHRQQLVQEAGELMKILAAILRKSE